MSRRPDPELDDLFGPDPELQAIAGLLRSSRVKPPPLDTAFRYALRRRVMAEAYQRYDHAARPSLFSRLFTGPRFALATAALAVLLIGVIYLQNGQELLSKGRGPAPRVYTTSRLVALDQPITVTFSQPMDHASVQEAIRIEPATQVTYQWQGNNLLIQPASGQLAANTQYHITVLPQATTAAHAPIGQAATIAVVTTGLPSPKPTPTATPAPAPRSTITGERSLAGSSGTISAWSADGTTIYFLAQNGDLDAIRTDGQAPRTLGSGVARVWISPLGRIAYAGRDGKLVTLSADGTPAAPPPAPAGPAAPAATGVIAAGWQGNRLLLLSATKLSVGGGEVLAALPETVDWAVFSPDGNRFVYRSGSHIGLFDVTTLKATPWPAGEAQKLVWSPDSSRVAFAAGDSIVLAAPDGTAPKPIAKSGGASTEFTWAGPNQLLVSGAGGLQAVRPDGGDPISLSATPYVSITGSPAGDRFGFSRAGQIWLADLKLVTPGIATLDQGFATVTAFETARISKDAPRAAGFLTASAARTTGALTTAGEPHLKRFFLVSDQQLADDGSRQRFLIRLILADEHDNEVRSVDEQLSIVAGGTGTDLKVDAVTDDASRPLGKGPTVNSVQILPTGLVVLFDSDLTPATVAGAIKVTGPNGEPVAVTTAYSLRQATITAQLLPGQRYRLVVGAEVKDIANQPLAGGAYEYAFQAPPAG